ncbi:MAG: tetratricopeptide repeat protein [Bdellovibrionales bacterium]
MSQDTKSIEKSIEQAIEVIAKNSKTIAIGLVMVVAVGLGMIGYDYSQESAEKQAYGEFYALEKQFDSIQGELRKNMPPEQDIQYTEEVFNQNFAGTSAEMEAFIVANKGRAAATMAAMELGELYSTFSLHQKAKDVLGLLISNVDVRTLTGALYHVEYGRVLLELNEFEASREVLNKVINENSVKFIHPVALLNLGLSYYKDNQMDKAKELLTRISNEFSDSEPGRSAEIYLKLINSTQG